MALFVRTVACNSAEISDFTIFVSNAKALIIIIAVCIVIDFPTKQIELNIQHVCYNETYQHASAYFRW